MSAQNRNQQVQEAQSNLERFEKNNLLIFRCSEFMKNKLANPLELKECNDIMNIARKDAGLAVKNYYNMLIHLGKIQSENALRDSFNRFEPAKQLPELFKTQLIQYVKRIEKEQEQTK